MAHMKTISIDVSADETIESFTNKLNDLGILHDHLDMSKEFKDGFKDQIIKISYDNRDMKWHSTVWVKPTS